MSYHEWKREATMSQILFGLQLPYRKPSSPIARFFWRRRVWVEVTFALSMLEPWEKFLVMFVMYATMILLTTACFLYLPQRLFALQERAAYYLFGSDVAASTGFGVSDSLLRLKVAASSSLNASLANVNSVGSSLVGLVRDRGAEL
ncbi:hypothetical protein BV20DRAFT_970650 [Pilatotrama ljubarskyi]|nr:hypothetical protein BV20DRAFT_970650 [Pilatotrama ljubarskyi]